MEISKPQRVWTVAEAKTNLSKILRLAEVEGPQTIGIRRPCVVVHENRTSQTPWPVAHREHTARHQSGGAGPEVQSSDSFH